MSRSVAVVTDSTAYLPQAEVSRMGITVVPLQVIIGDRVFDDGAGIDFADMESAFGGRSSSGAGAAPGSGAGVTTSRPAPERFAEIYAAAAAGGASAVVSVHLSGEMSGTV